jgi:hypothetical protein
MRILAILLMLAGIASAQPSGFSKPLLNLNQDGASSCIRAGSLDLSASDFSCSCTSVGAVCTLLSTVSKLGTCIGESSDFCGTVTRTSSTNIDGTIYGGTTDTATLELDASNSATQHGIVNLCGTATNVSTNSFTCTQILNGTLSVADGTNVVSAIVGSGIVTQTTDGSAAFHTPSVYFMRDTLTHQVTDSALNGATLGSHVSFDSAPTIKNNTDDNYTSGGTALISYYARPALVKGSAGTLTINEEDSFFSSPPAVPSGVTITGFSDFKAAAITVTGTLTNRYGFYADVGTGTNQYPYAAKEHTITGANVSGEGFWGVETGAPDRFFFENESGHIWRMGYSTLTGIGTTLATTATTDFFSIPGTSAANGTETTAHLQVAVPNSIHVFGMICGLQVAAGSGTMAHAFTLRSNAADVSGITCTITTVASECRVRVEAGVAVAAPGKLAIKDITTSTPTANDGTCTIYYTVDAW